MGGVTSGTQPILSFNYGAKNLQRVREAFRQILKLTLCFTTIMFLISQVAARFFVLIFTRDPVVIQQSVWGIRVFTLAIIPLAFQYTWVDGLTALGIAKVAITLSLSRKFTYILFTVLLPQYFDATAAFFAQPLADAIAGCLSTAVFFLLIGKILKKRAEMPDGQALYE